LKVNIIINNLLINETKIFSLKYFITLFLDSEFWKFSIDEMIEYDLPAIISYIKKETSKGIPKDFFILFK